MDKIEKIRAEIERRRLHFNKEAEKYQALNNGYSQNCYGARDALRDLENFLDTLSEEPDKGLEEAANKFAVFYDQGTCDGIAQDCFIAGAEWQKEQDLAEWSEEDENRLNAVMELLENTSAIHPNYSHRKLIIWLKSLRPSWKPYDQLKNL